MKTMINPRIKKPLEKQFYRLQQIIITENYYYY